MASTNGASTAPEQSGGPQSNLGKDEVAWFFVEQYYTTLSKTPEKLHLFYSKRSQFVYGQEAEVADVSVGRQNIQERIKSLDLSDSCSKVRISNVDSQTSYDNIVIQVIGETSNKIGDDPKKFVQTFVLAQQPSGYFVLNDILRYLDEDNEEEQGEAAAQEPAEEASAPAPATSAPPTEETHEEPVTKAESVVEEAAPSTAALDAGAIDDRLEQVARNDTVSVNGDAAAEAPAEAPAAAEEEVAAPVESTTSADPEETARQIEEEDTKEPEKPTDPSPTPVAARQPPAPQPAAPAQPPKPMTWASRAAAAAGPPRPVVPLPKTAAPAATPATQQRPAAPAASAASKPAASPAQSTETPAAAATTAKDEWQTAGSDSKRHNRPQSVSIPQADKDGVLGYVKYVTEKVQQDDLKTALSQHGEVTYLDINRTKSCAFVEFATPAGYQAAVAANPHVVNGENITVEPRRPKTQAYGGGNFGAGRGNLANRGGRGGFDGGRAGGQGGRGNFGQNRGRGGVRGRGGAQATA